MFTKITESFNPFSLSRHEDPYLLDDNFACDDLHPALFELVTLRKEIPTV